MLRQLTFPLICLGLGLGLAIGSFLLNLYYPSWHSESTNNFIIAIMIGIISWMLLKAFAVAEHIIQEKYKSFPIGSQTSRITSFYTRIHIIRNISSFVIIVIAIASILMMFNQVKHIGISLLASVGFLTALVALAAQKPLGSLFVGLQLILTEPIKLGDLVVIENETGTIEEITLTYAVIKLWDSRRLMLPTHYFTEKVFQNWSRGHDGLLSAIKLYVNPTVSIEPIREALHHIVKENSLWDGRIVNLTVSDLRETCIELRAIISAANPANMHTLCNEIREALLKWMSKHCPEAFCKLNNEHKT